MSITASWHCGQTAFRMDAEIPAQLTRCTCSFCTKPGALLAYCAPDQFHLTRSRPGTRSTVGKQDRSRTTSASIAAAPRSATARLRADRKWDGSTRRIGVNARLFDDFDAAHASIVFIDEKHLW